MTFIYNINEQKNHEQIIEDEFGSTTVTHVVTNITYTFDNGATVTLDVFHFQPLNQDAVILGIENRGVSESTKLAGG